MVPVPRHILLVDADPMTLLVLAGTLRAERPGWTVTTAMDGPGALAALRTRPVDVLVTEMASPALDGLELLAAVRLDPGLGGVPVIFITPRGDRSSLRQGMTAGVDDVLTRPFTVGELLDAVEARLRRRDQLCGRGGQGWRPASERL